MRSSCPGRYRFQITCLGAAELRTCAAVGVSARLTAVFEGGCCLSLRCLAGSLNLDQPVSPISCRRVLDVSGLDFSFGGLAGKCRKTVVLRHVRAPA